MPKEKTSPVKPATPNPQSEPVDEPKPGDEPAPDPKPEETPPEPVPAKDDPLLASLFEDLKDEPEIKPVAEDTSVPATGADAPKTEEDEDKDKPKDAPAPNPDPAKPPEKPAAPAVPKKKKESEIVTEPPEMVVAPVPATAREDVRPPEPEKPVDPDAEFVKTLNDDQREELAEYRKAEELFPEKYKGRSKKLLDWYRKLDATAQDLQTKDPARMFDENDQEWQAFIRTKPDVTPVDSKRVQRVLVQEELEAKMKPEFESKLADVERRQKAIELKPHIDRIEAQFKQELTKAIEGEVGDLIKKEGFDKAREQFPLEATIYQEQVENAAAHAREYMGFANGVAKYDANNPMHKWVLDFVNLQGQVMAERGGKLKIDKQGRKFLTREEYAAMGRKDPDVERKFWTHSHEDIVRMIAINGKREAEKRIESTLAQAEKLGLARKGKAVSAAAPKAGEPAKPDPEPIKPPGGNPKPAKGAAKPKAGEGVSGDPINVVSTLGLRSL